MAHENKHVLGRGKLYLALFAAGSTNPLGERYLGNTPSFALTVEAEYLDHFSSDAGIREKDLTVPVETRRSANLVTDQIDPKNVAIFFFGSADVLAQSSDEDLTETFEEVEGDLTYQLGISVDAPTGVRKVDNVVVKVGSDTMTLNEDYTLDADLGRVTIVSGGGISDGDDVVVEYDILACSRDQIISGNDAVEGALRFIADNPEGDNIDYYMPWVKLTPNGDYALKGEEWQQVPFNVEILKRPDRQAIYADGRPFTA